MNRKGPIAALIAWLGFAVAPAQSQTAVNGGPAATEQTTSAAARDAAKRGAASTDQKPDEVLVLASFQVESDKDEGYLSNQRIAGARTVESLKNTPNSISILNRELIDDLNATSVAELMSFSVAGGPGDNNEATGVNYVFRGQVSNITLRNSVNWFVPLDTFSIQRVEVLRGPQAFLYGEGAPGGLLNQITKQAIGRNFQGISLIIGSYGKRRVEVDVNRKLTGGAATVGTTAITDASGGYTLLPATGRIINTIGLRRSAGTNLAVLDPGVSPREYSFLGPDARFLWDYYSVNLALDQTIGKNLGLQAVATFQRNNRDVTTRAGTASDDIFVDRDATIGGVINPNFNELYTEHFTRSQQVRFAIFDLRATAIYKLQLPFTEQQLIATGVYKTININQIFFSEFVDPASSSFVGSLTNANTLSAYTANRTTYLRNYFYRRFYLKDGDDASITSGRTIVDRSIWLRDFAADGATGRLSNRKCGVPGYGFGASGTYFGGCLRSLFGWRRDYFNQDPRRDFYNPFTSENYLLASAPTTRVRDGCSRTGRIS